MRDAIVSGTPWSSVVISGHQWSSLEHLDQRRPARLGVLSVVVAWHGVLSVVVACIARAANSVLAARVMARASLSVMVRASS